MGLSAPKAFMLDQNYPNPFNPSTQIKYHITTADFVSLKVYNNLGQEVASLVNQDQAPGTYTATWNVQNVASGAYYYQLQVGNQVLPTKKALLIK